MITIKNTQRTVEVDINELKKRTEEILAILDYSSFDLGIWLTSEKTMREYNERYRKKDKPTDVLSFPFHEDVKAGKRIEPEHPDEKNLGDIIMCPAYIKEHASDWEQSFKQRMKVLLVHSICHLLGYDHIDDEDYKQMKALEDSILKKLSND